MLHVGEGVFVAHKDLGLHSADAGESREPLQEVAKDVAAAPAFAPGVGVVGAAGLEPATLSLEG